MDPGRGSGGARGAYEVEQRAPEPRSRPAGRAHGRCTVIQTGVVTVCIDEPLGDVRADAYRHHREYDEDAILARLAG